METVKAPGRLPRLVRVVSLLPAATELAGALGLRDEVVGVTASCDVPAWARARPRVVGRVLDEGWPSAALDAAVREAARAGRSLHPIDADLLRSLRPDVVLTQNLCEVCAASRPELERALDGLARRPEVVTLTATTLDEVLRDVQLVGDGVGRPAEARLLVEALEARIAAVEDAVRGAPRPRVACLEWLDPPMQGGHWVPDMVARAGGQDVLGKPGQHARYLSWQEVAEARPDVLVLMPCGFDVARTLREGASVLERPELRDVPARRAGGVVAVDGDAHFSRPGPRLVDGLEVLASILHPDRVPERFPWAWAPLPGATKSELAKARLAKAKLASRGT